MIKWFVAFMLFAVPASAQIVVAPATLEFNHPDAEFNITITYHIGFYQCNSISNNTCVGQAASPLQVSDVAKTAVTTPSFGVRDINLKTPPISNVLPSLPAGMPFVSTVVAVGDSSQPGVGGNSPESGASNPFFQTARAPLAVTAVRVR